MEIQKRTVQQSSFELQKILTIKTIKLFGVFAPLQLLAPLTKRIKIFIAEIQN